MVKEEIFPCELCDREFKSEEALVMHKKAKHSEIKEKESEENNTVKINFSKVRNWAIFLVVIGLILWGVFVLIPNSASGGEDFSKAVPPMGQEHVAVDSQLIQYNSNPPTSGPHYSTPARPGFRENILEDRYLIHSMEHGLIWISYNPRIGAEAEKLRDVVGPFTVITQRNANEQDIAVAAWGRLDTFNLEDGTIDADDLQRINNFVQRYANKGPENIPPGHHGGI